MSAIGFDPPLVDHFALIVRRSSRRSRPLDEFVDRVTSHLLARMASASR